MSVSAEMAMLPDDSERVDVVFRVGQQYYLYQSDSDDGVTLASETFSFAPTDHRYAHISGRISD